MTTTHWHLRVDRRRGRPDTFRYGTGWKYEISDAALHVRLGDGSIRVYAPGEWVGIRTISAGVTA